MMTTNITAILNANIDMFDFEHGMGIAERIAFNDEYRTEMFWRYEALEEPVYDDRIDLFAWEDDQNIDYNNLDTSDWELDYDDGGEQMEHLLEDYNNACDLFGDESKEAHEAWEALIFTH